MDRGKGLAKGIVEILFVARLRILAGVYVAFLCSDNVNCYCVLSGEPCVLRGS